MRWVSGRGRRAPPRRCGAVAPVRARTARREGGRRGGVEQPSSLPVDGERADHRRVPGQRGEGRAVERVAVDAHPAPMDAGEDHGVVEDGDRRAADGDAVHRDLAVAEAAGAPVRQVEQPRHGEPGVAAGLVADDQQLRPVADEAGQLPAALPVRQASNRRRIVGANRRANRWSSVESTTNRRRVGRAGPRATDPARRATPDPPPEPRRPPRGARQGSPPAPPPARAPRSAAAARCRRAARGTAGRPGRGSSPGRSPGTSWS